MTSKGILIVKPLGFMKFAFLITLILSVFFSLSVWVILNGAFKKELIQNSDQSQKDLVEPNNTNLALQKEIAEMEAEKTVKVNEFNNLKMVEIDSLFEAAKRKRKDKDDQEKVASIEGKELPPEPVFRFNEIEPLFAFKYTKSVYEKMVVKDISEEKLKGNPVVLNDSLIDFVKKRKAEIDKSEKYKVEFGKKWVGELDDLKKVDKEKALVQLNIKEVPKGKDGKPNGFTELKGDLNGLVTLLDKPSRENFNLFFAFDYFSPSILSSITVSKFDKDFKKEEDFIIKKRKELVELYDKYKIFLESIKKDYK